MIQSCSKHVGGNCKADHEIRKDREGDLLAGDQERFRMKENKAILGLFKLPMRFWSNDYTTSQKVSISY